MAPHPPVETTHAHGCALALRRVVGPEAREFYLACQPRDEAADPAVQAEAAYRAILEVLEAEGAGFASVVAETIFARNLGADLASIRAARGRVLGSYESPTHRPAMSELQQPPLDAGAHLEVAVQAVVPTGASDPIAVTTETACGCPECARSHALRITVGPESRLYAGCQYGRGADAYEQTLAMFERAENLLQRAGMAFGHVVRTWIHLREMDRDYDDLNRGRRAFFRARGIEAAPASTGIGAGLVPEGHDLCLGFYAVRAEPTPPMERMTTATLNEAPLYGSDFARGVRMTEANKVALHVSGTASIDEAGRTAHVGDFDAQADRMLLNVAALLEGQGAGFGDVVSAITYLKHAEDAERLRSKLREAGFGGFPNVLVEAPVCRPELLCEVEALAVLPHDVPAGSRRA